MDKWIKEVIEQGKDYLMKDDLDGFYQWLYFDSGLTDVENIDVDASSITKYFYDMGVDPLEYMTYVPGYAFYERRDMETFTVPNNIDRIGEYAFAGCQNLKSIVIPEGVRNIEQNAFISCYSLSSVKLPDTIEYIGDDAFAYCRIRNINVPKNLKMTHKHSFDGCSAETIEKFRKYWV